MTVSFPNFFLQKFFVEALKSSICNIQKLASHFWKGSLVALCLVLLFIGPAADLGAKSGKDHSSMRTSIFILTHTFISVFPLCFWLPTVKQKIESFSKFQWVFLISIWIYHMVDSCRISPRHAQQNFWRESTHTAPGGCLDGLVLTPCWVRLRADALFLFNCSSNMTAVQSSFTFANEIAWVRR